jgi:hypothetical protein
MTAKQFNAALECLELSHRTAATVLGIGRRSVIRYANDQQEVPENVRRMIVLLEKQRHPEGVCVMFTALLAIVVGWMVGEAIVRYLKEAR